MAHPFGFQDGLKAAYRPERTAGDDNEGLPEIVFLEAAAVAEAMPMAAA
jgi:hypothetical protein